MSLEAGPEPMTLDLGLKNNHVLITGGSGFIGSAVVAAFIAAGARVTSFDIKPPLESQLRFNADRFQYLDADISDEHNIKYYWQLAQHKFGPVHTCVALASLDLSVLPHHASLADMNIEQWRNTHKVNVEGTFLTGREWLRGIKDVNKRVVLDADMQKNVSLIIVGSESGRFGETGNADYASGKSAVQEGLVKSLVLDAHKTFEGARVNAVAPGAVDTAQFRKECAEDPTQYYRDTEATVPLRSPIDPHSVAKTILFLASSWAKDITGQVINVDAGKQGKLFWEK